MDITTKSLEQEISEVLERHNKIVEPETPDALLAEYVSNSLMTFNRTMRRQLEGPHSEDWRGKIVTHEISLSINGSTVVRKTTVESSFPIK